MKQNIIYCLFFLFFLSCISCGGVISQGEKSYSLNIIFSDISDVKKENLVAFCKVQDDSCGSPQELIIGVIGSTNQLKMKPDYPSTGDRSNISFVNRFLEKMIEDNFDPAKITNGSANGKNIQNEFIDFCKKIPATSALVFYSDKIQQTEWFEIGKNKHKIYSVLDSAYLDLASQLCKKNQKSAFVIINPILKKEDKSSCNLDSVRIWKTYISDYQNKMSKTTNFVGSSLEKMCLDALKAADEVNNGNCESYQNLWEGYEKIQRKASF